MKPQTIQQLLDKYFEGETSIQEEAQLREYFNQPNVDSRLLHYKPIFQYFEKAEQVQLSDDFEARLFQQLDLEEKPIVKMRPSWKPMLRIAATVAILLAVYFLVPINQQTTQAQAINWEQYETEDPELALEQTEAALRLLASKLNSGAKTATKEIEKVEAIAKVFKSK